MGRPRKYGEMRMDTDLRIPLTTEQKALIDEATADEPGGKAAWARDILLNAAKRKVAKERKAKAARKNAGRREQHRARRP